MKQVLRTQDIIIHYYYNSNIIQDMPPEILKQQQRAILEVRNLEKIKDFFQVTWKKFNNKKFKSNLEYF